MSQVNDYTSLSLSLSLQWMIWVNNFYIHIEPQLLVITYTFKIYNYIRCIVYFPYVNQRFPCIVATRKAAEDVAYLNMVKGVVAGVCLAIVFLIVLLFTYCYYKNRAFRGQRYDYPSKNFSKGEIVYLIILKIRQFTCKTVSLFMKLIVYSLSSHRNTIIKPDVQHISHQLSVRYMHNCHFCVRSSTEQKYMYIQGHMYIQGPHSRKSRAI